MKNGVCLKCKSEEVYVDSTNRHGIIVPVSAFYHQTHQYVCADCGYLEFYAQTGHDLSKIKQKWCKVKK